MTGLNPYGGIVPVKEFSELEEFYRSKGIDLRDVKKVGNHFEDWLKKQKYPANDDEGHFATASAIYFQEYAHDPDGMISCPPYVDIWKWLLEKFETSLSWIENKDDRQKIVPIISGAFRKPSEVSEEDIQAYKRRILGKAGQEDLDEFTLDYLIREYKKQPIADAHCIDMLEKIVEEHGLKMEMEGKTAKVMFISMRVLR
jgi:hypothetical protein